MNYSIRSPFRTQVTVQRLLNEPGLPLAHYLPAEQIHDACRAAGHVFRKRIFNPAVTLWMFLIQVLDPDHSCRKALARFLAYRTALGLHPCSANDGAYCRARRRLPEKAICQLTRRTGQALAEATPHGWLWKGRTIKIVDGTGLSMPDTPKNRRAYPVKKGTTFPVLRLVVIFNWAVGTVLDAALGPCCGPGSGELSLLRGLGAVFQRGDVWLGDRLYSSYWVVAQAVAAGADIVMRLNGSRKSEWKHAAYHSKGSKKTWWCKPPRPAWMKRRDYQSLPAGLSLRLVRVQVRQRGFRSRQVLVITTLQDGQEYPADDLAELYRRRWQAELDLRSLKETLQMDILRGKTPVIVRKEVWAHLLAYNLVRLVMAEAANHARLRPDELSFAGAWQTLHAYAPYLRTVENEEQAQRLWDGMIEAVACHRVGKRPNRVEPRQIKRHRHKNYTIFKTTRAQARRRSQQRHPTPKRKAS